MCLTGNSAVVLTSDKALRNAAVGAAALVACYLSSLPGDFTAALGHHGPVLVGADPADEVAEHASNHLIGWSGGLFRHDLDRVALLTTAAPADPYVRDLAGMVHAHRTVRVPYGDDEDERYVRDWMSQASPPF
jgi:hypothetical protein